MPVIKETFPAQQVTLPRFTIDGIYNKIKIKSIIFIKMYSVCIENSLVSKM
jgi:hypothetical protein